MGGLAGAILLILLVVLIIIGATVAMPFVGKQNINDGDYLIYKVTSSDGDVGMVTIVFMEVNTSTMEIGYVLSGDGSTVDDDTADYSYDGNVLTVDAFVFFLVPAFIDSDELTEFEASFWVSLSGFTPMLVQQYSGEFSSINYTIMLKMGTNLVVGAELSDGSDWYKVELLDSNIMWVKAV